MEQEHIIYFSTAFLDYEIKEVLDDMDEYAEKEEHWLPSTLTKAYAHWTILVIRNMKDHFVHYKTWDGRNSLAVETVKLSLLPRGQILVSFYFNGDIYHITLRDRKGHFFNKTELLHSWTRNTLQAFSDGQEDVNQDDGIDKVDYQKNKFILKSFEMMLRATILYHLDRILERKDTEKKSYSIERTTTTVDPFGKVTITKVGESVGTEPTDVTHIPERQLRPPLSTMISSSSSNTPSPTNWRSLYEPKKDY